MLDIAADGGRHSLLFLRRGHLVTAIDRLTRRLEGLASMDALEVIKADLEDGSPWPLVGRRFGAVIVSRYLWCPLFPVVLDALGVGGILLYGTFAQGQQAFGPPRRKEHLLEPGELVERVRGQLEVVAYEHGIVKTAKRARSFSVLLPAAAPPGIAFAAAGPRFVAL